MRAPHARSPPRRHLRVAGAQRPPAGIVEAPRPLCYSRGEMSGKVRGGKEGARFLCDAMLGRLCKWLRLLGVDARYADLPDEELLAVARAEGRVLLTRDTRLVRRGDVGAHCLVRSDHVQEQLCQVTEAFGLDPAAGAAGTRCLRCNAELEALPRPAAAGRVPPHVWRTHREFTRCPRCGRIYWPGTHWERMAKQLSAISLQPPAPEASGRGVP